MNQILEEVGKVMYKFGSGSVSNGARLDHVRIASHSSAIAQQRRDHGFEQVIVSSGAVAAGREFWSSTKSHPQPDIQTLAMMGSARANIAWQEALLRQGIHSGQLLVTHHEMDTVNEGGMLLRSLKNCLHAGVVPVINENDALSDVELAKLRYGGDNDGLAAHIATKLGMDRVLFLTGSVDGLLDGMRHVVQEVDGTNIDEALFWAGAPGAEGRGGMRSKVEAAWSLAQKGIVAHIANADADYDSVMRGHEGTTFLGNAA